MKYDYDIVVIGGGAAGLVAATGAAGLGAKTALIEKNKLGGDCTWYGCIPSKALLKSAQVFSLLKRLDEFGISGKVDCSPDGVMEHVRAVVKQVSLHHPPEVFEKRGVKVLFGNAEFIDNRAIQLGDRRISSKRFIICTGSHPFVPEIDGLKDTGYLTNETIFDLRVLPRSIAVLGGGPIGIEISQALARFGVQVSVIEMADRVLFREDAEAAAVLTDALVKDGVKIHSGKKAVRFSKEESLISITVEDKDKRQAQIKAEKILIAVGRMANTAGLGLEKAEVKYSSRGIEVNKYLGTTANNIYACGDVAGPYQFSHMAEYQAVIAVANAIFPFKQKVNYSTVTWCTFTEPELAHLGLTEEEARGQHKDVVVYKAPYSSNDRAVTDLEERGFSKVICDKHEKIIGAHIVGANAGELIHEYILAKSLGVGINRLSSAIHVYPTLAQVVKRSADQYYLNLLSSRRFKRLSGFFVALMR